jgi:hypothetical protein
MRAYRGKLQVGPGPGDEVFAASFIPRREIVFDSDLLAHAPDFVNIVAHEIYHFVWRRLPNAERANWSELLAAEKRVMHTGLSSRLRFEAWREAESPRRWKDYVCEAFCDTAAAMTHPNVRISAHRRKWFGNLIKKRKLPV